MMYPALTSLCFHVANFKELAPPTEESHERINRIYQLPDSDRTFSLHLPSSSQYSSSDMSGKDHKVFHIFDYKNKISE
ncbi:hypothetical protein Hanom_Chr10g00910621 [Helianthus anomalus]